MLYIHTLYSVYVSIMHIVSQTQHQLTWAGMIQLMNHPVLAIPGPSQVFYYDSDNLQG